MRRLALGAGWLAAALAGGFVTIVLQSAGVTSLAVALLIGNLLGAAVLAGATRRVDWGLAVAIGWLALAFLDYLAVTPLLNHLLAPLAPRFDPRRLPPQLPPRSAYLPGWIAFFTVFGLLKGALSAALLWWFLRSRRTWVLLWAAGGLLTALSNYWMLVLPVPGSSGAGLFILGPAVDAAAIALLWRWDASPPPIAIPAWVLERSGAAAS